MPSAPPPRYDVFGSQISLTSYEGIYAKLLDPVDDSALTVAFSNVHTVMTARGSEQLAAALEEFDIAAPDGMPLVWALGRIHHLDAERVHGPTFMRYAIDHGREVGLSHFLVGSTPGTLAGLGYAIEVQYPGALVAGSLSPPFRDLEQEDLDEVVERVVASGARAIWVGMGMPKQELLIHEIRQRLPGCALLGVGAAFDLIAGNQPEAPHWMKRSGLEWVFRFAHEPRRLWRRYLVNNPYFLLLLIKELAQRRRR
jgi:N-acetylglucosaminyldiphosphoundecaprenol N-acetyl-beta-D-mannosaminyltransferase